MNLAIIHDWLNQRGGAEDVLEALVATYPGSPVFTSIYQPAKMPSALSRLADPTALDESIAGNRAISHAVSPGLSSGLV